MPAPDLPPAPTFDVPTERILAAHIHMHDIAPDALAGCVVIVIDALRASVTITQALVSGAAEVIPVLTMEEARATSQTLRATHAKVLLGGERGGVLIPGFDLDNSPFSYTSERVRDATIVFTTSNGTAGLRHARHAARILVGSFANLDAVCDSVRDDPRPIHILCSGTRNDVSLDDCLPAGAMVERLLPHRNLVADDAARMCLAAWHGVSASLTTAMRDSRGGRNLVRMGLGRDVDFCSTPNTLPIVPVFDAARGAIRC
jgi:2-phosphosulfolactate phosphatase